MKDTLHLLYTPFTGLGKFDGYRGDDWFIHRMLIFTKYTIPSLLNQTNRDFIHWISFRPEERYHQMTRTIANFLREKKYNFIFTYGGPAFWDDKYPEEIEKNRFLERLKKNLPDLEHLVNGKYVCKTHIDSDDMFHKDTVKDIQSVYKTIIPSDDVFHKDMVQSIQEHPYENKGALIHRNGYVFNESTKQLAYWKVPEGHHSPPFYTLMYPANVFIDPQKHFDYVEPYRSHEDVETIFNCQRLPDNRYMVMTHENNISTSWYCKFKKGSIQGEERLQILKDFGL